MNSTANLQSRHLNLKVFLIGLAVLAPLLVLVWFILFPQTDTSVSLPLFHFYVVTFTTFSAAVIAILLSNTLQGIARPRHYLAAVAFAVIGVIFFVHGLATPGALIGYVHPAVGWSAWLTLFSSGAIFALASLDGPHGFPAWLTIRRITVLATTGVIIYLVVALFAPQALEWITLNTDPWHRRLIFFTTLGLWVFAMLRLGQIWRGSHSRVDGTLAFVSFWMAMATISMHQFPVWQLSWWLYHFILLIGFLVTIYILLAEYEQAREFSLLRYYLAVSLIVTALVALVASYLFAEFASQNLVAGRPDFEQAILQARTAGLLITAVSMSVLFCVLLIVVARADRIITHRTNELSAAYDKLRQAEAMRNDLTSMIIHDLRSPLTTIYGTLGLVKSLNDEEHAETRTYFLDQAIIASERMTGLIDDILAVSKIEAGQFEPSFESVSVSHLLSNHVDGFVVQAKEENKQLTKDYPVDLDAQLDPALIGRVTDNLISNAFKYTIDQIQVAAWAENQQLYVRVRDDGDGIPDDYKVHIFEKFAQAPNANKTPNRKGTGLGLNFCGLVVDLHGGKIWIEDAPGGGSDFIFQIPQSQNGLVK